MVQAVCQRLQAEAIVTGLNVKCASAATERGGGRSDSQSRICETRTQRMCLLQKEHGYVASNSTEEGSFSCEKKQPDRKGSKSFLCQFCLALLNSAGFVRHGSVKVPSPRNRRVLQKTEPCTLHETETSTPRGSRCGCVRPIPKFRALTKTMMLNLPMISRHYGRLSGVGCGAESSQPGYLLCSDWGLCTDSFMCQERGRPPQG